LKKTVEFGLFLPARPVPVPGFPKFDGFPMFSYVSLFAPGIINQHHSGDQIYQTGETFWTSVGLSPKKNMNIDPATDSRYVPLKPDRFPKEKEHLEFPVAATEFPPTIGQTYAANFAPLVPGWFLGKATGSYWICGTG